MDTTNERHIFQNTFNNEAEFYGHLMHVKTYYYANKYIEDKLVLDYGCGAGYGTFILTEKAKKVIGIDLSAEAIEHAKENYTHPKVDFYTIEMFNFEKYLHKFDVITSFQVIEHVIDETEYINRLYSLLKPGGFLLLSTPNKTNRLFSFIQKPWNKYHLKEYTYSDLNNLLTKNFMQVEILNMSAKHEFVIHEINRVKKQKIITLPVTLFIYPLFLRLALLKLQAKLLRKLIFLKNKFSKKQQNQIVNFISAYSINEMIIAKNLNEFTDFFIICRK